MSTTSTTAAKAENSIGQVQFLTITALFIALTYVLPHSSMSDFRSRKRRTDPLGNVPLSSARFYLAKKAVHSPAALAWDFLICSPAGLAVATFHFVIVAIMGYVVGAITEKHHGLGFDALAIVAACVIKVVATISQKELFMGTGSHRLLPFLEIWYRSVLQPLWF